MSVRNSKNFWLQFYDDVGGLQKLAGCYGNANFNVIFAHIEMVASVKYMGPWLLQNIKKSELEERSQALLSLYDLLTKVLMRLFFLMLSCLPTRNWEVFEVSII